MKNPRSVSPSLETDYRADQPGRTLLRLFWPERRQFALSFAFWLVKNSPVWALPIITANVIDALSPGAPRPLSSLEWNAFWGTLIVFQNIPTHILHNNALSGAIRRTETRLRSSLCRHLQELSIAFFKNTSTGLLQSKAMRDVENIGLATRELFTSGLNSVATVLVVFTVTAWRASWFLPIFLVATPLVAVLHQWLRRRLGGVNTEFRREFESFSARFLGMLDMIPVTRAHALEENELAQIEQRLGQVQEAGLRLDIQNGVVNAWSWVALTQFGLLGLIFTAWLAYRRIVPLSAGEVVLMAGYFSALTNVLIQFLGMLPTISRGLESVQSLGDVLECPDIEENRGKRPLLEVCGGFDFQNVAFVYRRVADGRRALSDFTLRIEPGETIGVVGPSGSGKSTLMSLVMGFHRPTSGQILLDGQDMNDLDLRSYRQSLAVVSQETILFDGTVRENILYGAPAWDERALRAALENANAAEFIDRLPDGLETLLGENGARLSGGQRQRLAIARALIRSPRVLILDEATSALDTAAEGIVQDALDRLMENRTTLIVAHRLSTLRGAQRIVVLESGRIVEIGTPEELRRIGGVFARLRAAQSPPTAGNALASVSNFT